MTTPLTNERVKSLEEILPEVDSSEESIAVIEDLIAFWREKQPKVCRHCGFHRNEHVPDGSFLQCYNKYGTPLETTYKE